MKLYGGIDMHSTNSYIVLIDEQEKVVLKKRSPNELQMIIQSINLFLMLVKGLNYVTSLTVAPSTSVFASKTSVPPERISNL